VEEGDLPEKSLRQGVAMAFELDGSGKVT